jgi:hypothetical protein
MKNHHYYWLLLILVGVVILGAPSQMASANHRERYQGISQSPINQVANQTPVSTESPSVEVIETSESRMLPPVGSNSGLVIGASVLVLIIIGGVLGSRRRDKH